MPRNIVPRIVPIHINVVRAFLHSGGLNAGTPFEIASTPVIAAEPEANACRPRKTGIRRIGDPRGRMLGRAPGPIGAGSDRVKGSGSKPDEADDHER